MYVKLYTTISKKLFKDPLTHKIIMNNREGTTIKHIIFIIGFICFIFIAIKPIMGMAKKINGSLNQNEKPANNAAKWACFNLLPFSYKWKAYRLQIINIEPNISVYNPSPRKR